MASDLRRRRLIRAAFFVFRKSGGAVGAIATHIDGIPGCGGPDLPLNVRRFSEKWSGKLKVQEKPFVRMSMVLAQAKDFSATLTREDSTENLELLPAPPGLWGGRGEPVSSDETKMRQSKLGELCWVATFSRPDICAQ